MVQRIAGASALFLLAAQPSLGAETATPTFAKALGTACQPWMEGAERKTLGAKLQAEGWTSMADVMFSKSGSWGRVMVALQQPSGTGQAAKPAVKRTCQVYFNTNEQPWSTAPAATVAAGWIAGTFPSAEQKNAATLTIEDKPVDAATWKDGKTTVTQVIHQTKQNPPDTDILLKIEND